MTKPIRTNSDKPSDWKHNTDAILDRLARGFCALPPGVVNCEQLVIGPDCSGGALCGVGASTVLAFPKPHAAPNHHGIVIWGEGFADPGPSDWNAEEGSLTVPDGSRLDFPPGEWVYVTSGAALGDPLTGEFRRVLAYVGDHRVRLDRPLRRSYANARLATGRPVADLTIADLTIAQPWSPDAYKLVGRRVVNLTLDRVRFGLPGELPAVAGWSFAETGDLRFLDVDSPSTACGLNTTYGAVFRGGRLLSLVLEENSGDCDVDGTVIAPAGHKYPGVKCYLGSERLRLRNVRVEGGGAAADEGGSHAPLTVYGRQCRLEGVEAVGSLPPYGNGLGGDGLEVYGCRLDLETWVTEGLGITLRDVCVPKWVVFLSTSGRASGCPGLGGQDGWTVAAEQAVAVPAQVAGDRDVMTSDVVDEWKRRRGPVTLPRLA